MGHRLPVNREKHIADLWGEVSLIRSFQEIYDKTDPVGRKARRIRLAQIARELRLMGETTAVRGSGGTKRASATRSAGPFPSL